MKLFSKKKEVAGPNRTQALACIPHKSPSVTWETVENGDILIEYPLTIKPFFIQLARRFNKGQEQKHTKQLQLDNMGSLVWQMFDGTRDVKTIVREVAKKSGLSLQEAEISVTTFLRELGRRGLVIIS
jgi:hypothetical protein